MPAKPAWPPKSLPRLFVRQPLAQWVQLEIDGAQAHYLGTVLRLDEGDQLLLFDGDSGEWLGKIVAVRKRRLIVSIERHVRDAESVPDLSLAFAPIKRVQVDWLVEKATELGIARLIPVVTQRTVVERVKLERLQTIAIEAAEQCGRTRLPEIDAPVPLATLLKERDPDRRLYFADEQGGEPLARAFAPGAAIILTGPEGGFTDDERAAIRGEANSIAVSLGPRTLRAETAALAALAAWMAIAGDWRS
ncbi:MAG: 16S rRNA (uracil(1498)-N(3))-methyltransferase [Sphingomicrobium sp.]